MKFFKKNFNKNTRNYSNGSSLESYLDTVNAFDSTLSLSKTHKAQVMKDRHSVSQNVLPVKNAIKIITNSILQIDLLCRSKAGNKTITNPLIDIFNNQNISLLHATYEDFLSSVVKNYLCIDGVLYVLKVENLAGVLLQVEIVNSCNLTPFSPNSSVITRYQLSNFLGITISLTLSREDRCYYYTDRNYKYTLYATDIAFESGDNLQFSPLLAVSQHISLYNYAITRGVALNEKSSNGTVLFVPVASEDQEQKDATVKKYMQNLKGVENSGNTMIIPISAIGDKDRFHSVKIGNSYADYNVHQDTEFASKSIYQTFGVPLTIVNQDASYSGNQLESFKQFYELTIIPGLMKISSILQAWLLPSFGYEDYTLEVNKSSISVFEQAKIASIKNLSGIMSLEQQQKELGLEVNKNIATEDKVNNN